MNDTLSMFKTPLLSSWSRDDVSFRNSLKYELYMIYNWAKTCKRTNVFQHDREISASQALPAAVSFTIFEGSNTSINNRPDGGNLNKQQAHYKHAGSCTLKQQQQLEKKVT